ncbi:hypothetical protein EYF80_036710 [Liparis tanakae]|uniref:Uncharacterized protein n=1 Tax=Liparis tanakae TaxID=230148 RepID=A0A4Z2GIL1_9TELE|nr:hypothetical protein EYF80_036710 [Liparis tanakae]
MSPSESIARYRSDLLGDVGFSLETNPIRGQTKIKDKHLPFYFRQHVATEIMQRADTKKWYHHLSGRVGNRGMFPPIQPLSGPASQPDPVTSTHSLSAVLFNAEMPDRLKAKRH